MNGRSRGALTREMNKLAHLHPITPKSLTSNNLCHRILTQKPLTRLIYPKRVRGSAYYLKRVK
jgi:hypothetical protein